jgi:hypothetical protein
MNRGQTLFGNLEAVPVNPILGQIDQFEADPRSRKPTWPSARTSTTAAEFPSRAASRSHES